MADTGNTSWGDPVDDPELFPEDRDDAIPGGGRPGDLRPGDVVGRLRPGTRAGGVRREPMRAKFTPKAQEAEPQPRYPERIARWRDRQARKQGADALSRIRRIHPLWPAVSKY